MEDIEKLNVEIQKLEEILDAMRQVRDGMVFINERLKELDNTRDKPGGLWNL